MSSYEEYFEKLLKKNKIQYKKEVTFLISIRKMR